MGLFIGIYGNKIINTRRISTFPVLPHAHVAIPSKHPQTTRGTGGGGGDEDDDDDDDDDVGRYQHAPVYALP